MFEFSDSISEIDCGRTVRIVRVPWQFTLDCYILSDKALAHAVHWSGERTIPHLSKRSCAGCEREYPMKIEIFMAIWQHTVDRVRILEMTDFAAQPVLAFQERFKSIKGHHLIAYRLSKKKNGRITCEIQQFDRYNDVLPICPDVPKHVSRLWEKNAEFLFSDQVSGLSGQALQNLGR